MPRYSQPPAPVENYQPTGYSQQVYTTAATTTPGNLFYPAQVQTSVLESTRNSSFQFTVEDWTEEERQPDYQPPASKEEAEEDEKSPFHEEDANKDPEPEPEAGVGS